MFNRLKDIDLNIATYLVMIFLSVVGLAFSMFLIF